MTTATANIFFDTRIKKNEGFYPVKLTIYFNKNKKRYSTGFDLTPVQWKKINGDKLKDENLKETKAKLNEVLKKANDIIKSIESFSFVEFEKLFFSIPGESENIFFSFNEKIKKLDSGGRPGTANSYKGAMKSLKSFTGEEILLFPDITPDFLKAYEKYMTKQSKTLTTVGIYLRCVRALYNDLLSNTTDKKNVYPFGKNKYIIPGGSNIKKALTLADIERIYKHLPPTGTMEQWGRDMWVFSYLCNGLNIADISRLKYKNLQTDTITFLRKKTLNTGKANLKNIEIILNDEALRIIERWGNKPQKPETYIFPILKDNMTAQQELAAVKQETKNINKHINRIALYLGIKEKVTTYTARHSYATVLKRSGVSIEFISESLGHSNTKVTENYLSSFETDKKREVAKNLTNF